MHLPWLFTGGIDVKAGQWVTLEGAETIDPTTPGLHFKYPFIEKVVFLDNRILVVEAPKQEVLASDNNRLDVDSFLRYRIVDPLKFYQTVGSPERANSQLGSS